MSIQDEILSEEKLGFPFNVLNRGLHSADNALYGRRAKNEMKVDVQETEAGYSIDIDLPGFKKDQISLELTDGVLTVAAEKHLEREKDDEGRLIRQERFSGELKRSFYVGEMLDGEDVRARYADGVLHLELPKIPERELERVKRIPIEDPAGE